MRQTGVIYKYSWDHPRRRPTNRLSWALIALALGGMAGPMIPAIRLETSYALRHLIHEKPSQELPKSVPVIFNPLKTEDGSSIDPLDINFGLVIPKIGVNASVIPGVNPTKPGEYLAALEKGVAHASTSYFPDEDGTVYLFSHSTNYDWFVKDLNAVFYLLKNLTEGDLVVVFYQGKRYTYRLTEKRVVAPEDISYLVPQTGKKRLILQTCWPPGSTLQRLLIFADLVEEYGSIL